MTGIHTPNQTSELETATIAVLAVAAAEFLKRSAEDLQLIHDFVMDGKDDIALSTDLKQIVEVSKRFYFCCFITEQPCEEIFKDDAEVYNALKHVAIVVQPPASHPRP